jgi:membrane protein implicated in regulation of membrane protease activity
MLLWKVDTTSAASPPRKVAERSVAWPRAGGETMGSWSTDPLGSVYLFCFAFGLIFSLGSLVLRFHSGQLHLPIGHADGHGGPVDLVGHHDHLAVGHGHDATHDGTAAHGSHHPVAGGPSPLNLSSAMVFLLWFGATGYILHVYYGALAGISLAAAAFVGWIGAAALYLVLSRVLWRGQTALDPANYEVAGAVGRVTSAIHAGGTGEVVYALDGKRQVDGARSEDGAPIASGTEVAILDRRNGLVYVCPLTWGDEREPPA